ncbi:MAG: putative manganese transporter [Clostridia bacterium]
MWDVLLDAFVDSLKILAIFVVVYIAIGLLEGKISNTLERSKKWTPLLGVTFAILPQCGFSVIATDLYQKQHITVGALIGIYLATSDEALPILLAHPDKALAILPLIAIKFCVGVASGYIIDLIFSKKKLAVEQHSEHCDEHEEEVHIGCCGHEIESVSPTKASQLKQYLLHPILHSLKIFVYVFVINVIFGMLIFYIGEDKLTGFLQSNEYIAPFFAVLVGLIPNCASSVVLTNLYILGGISFGACVGGLCANAGLGVLFLFKNNRHNLKQCFAILGILVGISLFVGYGVFFLSMLW